MNILNLADTHNLHHELNLDLSNIDMIIHAGDFTRSKSPAFNSPEAENFLQWFSSLPVKYKVLVPGNHDTSLAAKYFSKDTLKTEFGIDVLIHESIVIEGIKIFGSPYTPTFGTGWAYNVARHKLQPYWDCIDLDTDILVTHGPPYNTLDAAENGKDFTKVGDKTLMNRVHELNILYHIFGHIHEDAGKTLKLHNLDTIFINASVVNLAYKIINSKGLTITLNK